MLIPVYKNMSDCMKKHPEADVLINFASLRSAYKATIESMNFPQIRTIAIIAEGIPENLTRKINKEAANHGVTIIGEWSSIIKVNTKEAIPENLTRKINKEAANHGVTIIGESSSIIDGNMEYSGMTKGGIPEDFGRK